MNYPDLKDQPIISLDIETYDPLLLKKGTGVYRKDGRILGVSIATPDGFAEYYNIGHNDITADMRRKNLNFLSDTLKLSNKKLGANILYDLDWLVNGYGLQVNGEIHDVQYAEPLLDEYAKSFSLNSLGMKYLGVGKEKNELEEFCTQNKLKGDPRQHIHLMPYELVRAYAIADAQLPIEIFKKQWEEMYNQELLPVYHMEVGLIPLLLHMKRVGVRIDNNVSRETYNRLEEKYNEQERRFRKEFGEFNYYSSAQIAGVFKKMGIPVKTTEKGNPSVPQEHIKALQDEYPICKQIVELKKLSRVLSAVYNNVIRDPEINVNGRIHAGFHPLRSDDRGTVSGRFSSTNPNLQQIPKKGENYGDECRKVFVPEEGQLWAKLDYSQIEYRVMAHYARGERSDLLRQKYNEDPNTDYHQTVMNWTGLDRSYAKNLNFGTMYAMGVRTCSATFGWTPEKSSEVIRLYHSEMPYVKTTMNNVIDVAKGRGFIRTIMKRRARMSEQMKQWGKYYVMFNRLIQGSAADIMKKGMLDAWNKGLFNVLTPHITVHDEMDVSVPNTKEGREALRELKYTMENCIELKVPIKVDAELGTNWADVSEERAEKFLAGE